MRGNGPFDAFRTVPRRKHDHLLGELHAAEDIGGQPARIDPAGMGNHDRCPGFGLRPVREPFVKRAVDLFRMAGIKRARSRRQANIRADTRFGNVGHRDPIDRRNDVPG